MSIKRIAYPGVVALAVLAGPAQASEDPAASREATAPGWIATLGFATEVATGGQMSILPSTIDLRRSDEPEEFGAPDDVFGFGVVDTGRFELGPAVDWRHADGRFAVDAGAYAQYWAIENRLRLRVEALHNIGADDGGHVTLGSDLVFALRSATASVGPRLTVGDSDYFRTTADSRGRSASGARFYAGATAALKVPVNDALSATIYNEMQVPLSGNGEQDGDLQNTVGLELDFSFALPKLR